MIRAVVDTNVLVSALISPHSVSAQVLNLWRDDAFLLLTSDPILTEVERVLTHPRLRHRYGLSVTVVSELMRGLHRFAFIVGQSPNTRDVCRDPDDDKFLACAIGGEANYLVTGDDDLLALDRYEGVHILNPAAFVEEIAEMSSRA